MAGFFRTINPAAVAFGILFIIQGALFGWFGVLRRQLMFRARLKHADWSYRRGDARLEQCAGRSLRLTLHRYDTLAVQPVEGRQDKHVERRC